MNVLRWGAQGSDTDEGDRFLQERLALYAKLMGGFFSALYLVGALVVALVAPQVWLAVHLHPSKVMSLLLPLGYFLSWLKLQRGALKPWRLRCLDMGLALFMSFSVGFSVSHAPRGYHAETFGLLVMIVVLVLRAALVPSEPKWTALVGAVAAPALLLAGYQQLRESPLGGLPVFAALTGMSVWCVASVVLTSVVSRIVYGLVSRVREATRLGQYTLREKVGEGGMGAVYRAEHAMLRRATAVKLLLPERVGSQSLMRFEREVQLTSQLSHPNTVAIYDYGRTREGVFYYAMEFLEGKTLDSLVRDEGPQNAGRVVHVLRQALGSLSEAHAVGLVHRDVKPSNILLCTRGGIPEFVKVIDFGLVKPLGADSEVALTQTGTLAGTPLFMAPECVVNSDAIGPPADTYALGCVGYFMLTGTTPFTGATMIEVCGHHLHTPPTPPSDRTRDPVPALLEKLILSCLAKDSSARPNDRALALALEACQKELPWPLDSTEAQAISAA
ncbi:MAG: serine/threonine-protein kinase [Polyangiaceae bacterium]